MQPNDSLHPALHFAPPNVHVLPVLLDEPFWFVSEPQAAAKMPVANKANAAASHCFVIEGINILFCS